MGSETGPPSTLDSLEVMLRAADGAPAIPPALGKGAAIGGRYVIESVLGTGGMGVVYLARDQQLGRPVALKLHRTLAASDRLRREAVAMAKLSHPNVVGVYEVGDHEDRSFVAMEYVEGQTLRAWAAAKPRTRAELLAALAAAGEGLAAAHRAGLVHRDVKPENIFVGTTGRVRIGDFGLVRIDDSEARGEPLPELAIGDGTKTGTVLGTPAYMAPEQLEGGALDARTDQFALAVVAWELLSGKRPFVGDTTSTVRDAMARGPSVAAGKIPARLRHVLGRALAVDPAHRWPSVHALVAALQAAERRPRLIAAAATAFVVAGGVATYALWPEPAHYAACEDASVELAAVPSAQAWTLVTAIATSGTTTADDRAIRVRDAIGNLRTRYAFASTAACHAKVDRAWSPEILDASRECLAAGSVQARTALFALPVSALSAPDIVQLAANLPTFAACSDVRVLVGAKSLVPAGGDPAAVFEARARADVASQLVDLGRIREASALRDLVASSAVAAVPSVAHRLALLTVSLDVAQGRVADAEERMRTLYFEARARDDAETMLRSIEALVRFTGVLRRDREPAKRWSELGISDAEREAVRYPDLAAAVIAAAAEAANERGDDPAVFALADRALVLTTALTPVLTRSAIYSVRHLAFARQGKTADAAAASAIQLETLRYALGANHPTLAYAWAKRARTMTQGESNLEATIAADHARAIVDAEPMPGNVMRARAEISIAGAILASVPSVGAEVYLDRARETIASTFGPDHPDMALVDVNYSLVHLDNGENEKAKAALERALAVQEKWLGPTHVDLATTLTNLSVPYRLEGNFDRAIELLERAVAIQEAGAKGSPRHVAILGVLAVTLNAAGRYGDAALVADRIIGLADKVHDKQARAMASLEGGRARVALGTDLGRARELLTSAHDIYSAIEMPKRVSEAKRLLLALEKL